ncbi:type II toxin-antitoxin system Phd/YefM family antitoxin [Holosporaceae bacterium 'Namur']|nr:type II toxin-antitoxin system Phd/YefM family antitoxin [Holosporaceae bacterium 'Namur']
MRIWQLQEAKAKFSELVKLTQYEPQIVSIRGKEEVIVLSVKEYNYLKGAKPSLTELMQQSPLKNYDIDFSRDSSPARNIEL